MRPRVVRVEHEAAHAVGELVQHGVLLVRTEKPSSALDIALCVVAYETCVVAAVAELRRAVARVRPRATAGRPPSARGVERRGAEAGVDVQAAHARARHRAHVVAGEVPRGVLLRDAGDVGRGAQTLRPAHLERARRARRVGHLQHGAGGREVGVSGRAARRGTGSGRRRGSRNRAPPACCRGRRRSARAAWTAARGRRPARRARCRSRRS